MATITIPKILANFETSLNGKISASATDLVLNTSVDDDGTTLSGTYSLTIDEGTTSEEHMVVTLAGSAGTITRRGLSRVDAWTEVTENKIEHNRGASVKITNVSAVNIQRLLAGTDTFNAVDWSGINSISGLATPSSTETTKAANVGMVNDAIAAGGVDSSTVAKGIGKSSYAHNKSLGTATITIASPAVITLASHGLIAGDSVLFTTSGSLPTGITASTNYYVISSGLTANGFQVSTTSGGTAVDTSGSQSGTHTLYRMTPFFVSDVDPRVPTQSENDALVGTSGTPSTSNPFVTTVDRRMLNVYKYGDGSDGDATISSPTTLTRDMYYNNLTINDGITLTTAGYRVFVAGTLTQLGTGKMACVGGNGGNGGNGTVGVSPTGGAGGTGGTAGAASSSGTLKGGVAGVAGGAGGTGGNALGNGGASPSGNAGVATTASITNPTATSQTGNAGGAGGTSGGSAGGTVGTVGAAGSVVTSGVKIVDALPIFTGFSSFVSGTYRQLEYHAGNGGSTGGGGGGCSSSPGAGGGGGGAGGTGGNGGTIAIFANAIVTASNPIASVVGGNGGNGGNGATGANTYGGGGGGAGGSGGNGGLVFISYVSLSGSLTATLTGGTGGTGGTGAAGSGGGATGSNGATGSTGISGLLITVQT